METNPKQKKTENVIVNMPIQLRDEIRESTQSQGFSTESEFIRYAIRQQIESKK